MQISTSFFILLPLAGWAFSSCSPTDTGRSEVTSPVQLTQARTPDHLSITTACALAVSHHPSLATYPVDKRAADARILRATRIPNPVLTIDDEDFFGTGSVSGLSASVLNSLLTQVIERGGKRQARTEAAKSEAKVLDAEYDVRRHNLLRTTGELFLNAVAAREEVLFLEKTKGRSEETAKLVAQLVDAGRLTKASIQQANLDLQKTRLELNQARKASEAAAQALTSLWGDSRTTLVTNQCLEAPPLGLASKSTHREGLRQHPKVRYLETQVALADDLVVLAKANKLGDPTVGAGIRHASEANEFSGLFSISLPLPVFNNREDAIVEMTALADKARIELAGTKRALNTEFDLAWSDLVSAHETASLIKRELLPTASSLFDSAEISFRTGKITSLEYLAAQQQFHEISGRWLEARHQYHLKAAHVQSLSNRPL